MPAEERSHLISLAQFDENKDDWIIKKERKRITPRDRVFIHNYRRPITEYCFEKNDSRYRVSISNKSRNIFSKNHKYIFYYLFIFILHYTY